MLMKCIQILIAMRVIQAYWTVSAEADLLPADMVPLIFAQANNTILHRFQASRRECVPLNKSEVMATTGSSESKGMFENTSLRCDKSSSHHKYNSCLKKALHGRRS